MSAGDDFSLKPNNVTTLEPKYYNVITESESAKKEYMNISSSPVERYELKFAALDDADWNTLLSHYKDNYGGYHSFTWKSVPTYIGTGANLTGRWVDGSLHMESHDFVGWKCSIIFEKAIT